MAIIVNTNMSALKTRRNLNNATTSLNRSLERMSTGLKINSAKDDSAGLYVAASLYKQISGSKVAQSNIATGSNVLSTIEGDLDVMLDNLNRIRDLAVQASNGVYDTNSRTAMSDEVAARFDEIDRVAKASNFNGLKLLDSDAQLADGLRLQVGANAEIEGNRIVVDAAVFADSSTDALGLDPDDIVTNFATGTAAAQYLEKIDNAIATIIDHKSIVGVAQSRLESASSSLTTTIENATAARSTIMDADIAEESAEYTKQQILQQTSAALLVQANNLPSLALNLIQ